MGIQKPLFGENGIAVQALPADGTAQPQTKAQRAFSRLVEKIEAQRQALAAWQEFLPHFHQRLAMEMVPLQQRCETARLALALLFDAAHDREGTTRREQDKLEPLILDICIELLQGADEENLEVVALHDKYSHSSLAERKEEESRFLMDMAETVFGVDLGESADQSSPQTIRAALHRKMAEQQTQEQAQQQADQAQRATQQPAANAGRRKSAKALAREAREAAQAQAATMSVREIYRKLASALHPDREPDEAERQRKTGLMQQVNQAYANMDLLRLLELQIQVEQIDLASLGSLTEQRLGHYNAVLAEQSAQLEHEIDALTSPFQHQTGVFGGALRPQTLSRTLDGDLAALRHEARRIEHDVKRLGDRAVLKAWLRGMKVQRQRAGDDLGEEIFDAFKRSR